MEEICVLQTQIEFRTKVREHSTSRFFCLFLSELIPKLYRYRDFKHIYTNCFVLHAIQTIFSSVVNISHFLLLLSVLPSAYLCDLRLMKDCILQKYEPDRCYVFTQPLALATPARYLLRRGDLMQVSVEDSRNPLKRLRPKFKPVYMFLFNDLLLLAKKKRYDYQYIRLAWESQIEFVLITILADFIRVLVSDFARNNTVSNAFPEVSCCCLIYHFAASNQNIRCEPLYFPIIIFLNLPPPFYQDDTKRRAKKKYKIIYKKRED